MPTSKRETFVAVFDVDGTLVEDNIGLTFVKYLISRGVVHPIPRALITVVFLLYKIRILDFKFAIYSGAWAMAGVSESEISDMASNCFEELIRPKLFKDGIAEIQKYHNSGIPVILATGAHHAIARRLASYLGVDHFVATNSEVKFGRYTYSVQKPVPYRVGKRDQVVNLAAKIHHQAKLIVYSDERKDLPLLQCADVKFAVNPDEDTRKYVAESGGQVLEFR